MNSTDSRRPLLLSNESGGSEVVVVLVTEDEPLVDGACLWLVKSGLDSLLVQKRHAQGVNSPPDRVQLVQSYTCLMVLVRSARNGKHAPIRRNGHLVNRRPDIPELHRQRVLHRALRVMKHALGPGQQLSTGGGMRTHTH